MHPTGNGTASRIEHAFEGETALVWGHEGPDDLRVVDDRLMTIGVLPPPFPGFHIKGASISEGGVRAFVWGMAGGMANDTIVTYNLTTFTVEQDYLPEGLVDLVSIDYVRTLAWGIILTVAGRHVNGTSELLFIETVPMQQLGRLPLPGNASAQYLGSDGISMVCLLDDGQLVVVSTRDWSMERTLDAVDGPFSAWYITHSRWFFGGADGTVLIWNDYAKRVEAEMHMDGPVEGIARTIDGQNQTLTVAIAIPEGGSVLRTFKIWTEGNWSLAREEPWPVAVSMLGAHPKRGDAILVCGSDGSIEPLEVRTWTDYTTTKRPRLVFVAVAVGILIGVYGSFLWSRRGRSHG